MNDPYAAGRDGVLSSRDSTGEAALASHRALAAGYLISWDAERRLRAR